MNSELGKIESFVFLPNHLHLLIRQGTISFSDRVRSFKIKSNFKISGRQTSIWQSRFWEHRICDEDDYNRHADYIHYNPVKHGYVVSPRDWQYSSFHGLVKQGIYPIDWSEGEAVSISGNGGE